MTHEIVQLTGSHHLFEQGEPWLPYSPPGNVIT